ncbi:hypothetical protein C1645_830887 [Glomus cerebriforme]|uniref:BRCT domain-containing protein n=1 Tax=Glomus cerebriforme TaxID=658196 RepID=A0A397SN40_9GLOM|nr:hypothetical protein C1645_830887 [Glomus cerebriforme]
MDMNVVLAGNLKISTHENYVSRAQKNGYKVSGNVTKSTEFLVCGSDCEQSIIENAKVFGARIISEDKWVDILLKSEVGQTTGRKGMETSKEHETKKLAKDNLSDSSVNDICDENEYKQKKQKLDDEDPESDATLLDDEIGDINNDPLENCAAALKEEGEEMNKDLSNINSLPPLPSYVTNPKNIMSIMNGNTVNVLLAFLGNPMKFIKGLLNDMDLDGELFGGRGKFQSTISIVKVGLAGVEEWKNIRYEIFDVLSLGKIPFENCINYLKNMMVKTKPKYARLIKQRIAESERDVYDELDRVEKLDAEGLMLQAIVIGHEPGKGKYLRQCGSLICRMASEKEFKELSNSGSSRFPIYLGPALDKDAPTDPDFGQKLKVK